MPSAGATVFLAFILAFATLVVIAFVAVVRDWLRSFAETEPPGERPSSYGEGEKALVPMGPPRRPKPSASVALPLPEPEPKSVEAYGREFPEKDTDADALAG